MRQMAVITPYAQFQFKFVSDTPEYVYIYFYSDSPSKNNYAQSSYTGCSLLQQECHCEVCSQNRCNATHSYGDKTSSILC